MSNLLSSFDSGIISTKNTIRDQIPLLIIGSLTLVLTLQWNNVITELINKYMPINEETNDARNRFLYVFVLTIIVFVLIAIVNGVASFLKTIV